MSESGQIGSGEGEGEAEAALGIWEVGEKDPSNVSLDERMDDLDKARPEFETIPEVDEEFQGNKVYDEGDISISEDEKTEAPGFSEPQPAREKLGGDLEITKAIPSSSENSSRLSPLTPREESSPLSAPVLKEDVPVALPDASAGSLETGRQKEVKGNSLNFPSSTAANTPQPAEWIYRTAAPIIRNPYRSTKTKCVGQATTGGQVHDYAKPNSSRRRSIRNLCLVSSTNPYGAVPAMWEVNPAASVPMRARCWKACGSRKPCPVSVEGWKKRENAVMDRRDRDLAKKLGYDTLVGNLVHINIPGARDLNRSWKHFLSQDAMSWGFPYWKGSTDKPQAPAPPPYLVHELKEKFWKNPRARSFKTAK